MKNQSKLITISHKQQEILWIVCKLPKAYINIRRKELAKDYASHLIKAAPAYRAFLVMIGVLEKKDLCTQGLALIDCYKKREEYKAFG